MNKNKQKGLIKKTWDFLREDTWQSLIVFLVLALIFIKFIFFPILSAVTGTTLPLVIVESCSMYHHEKGFEKTFQSRIYEEKGILIEDTKVWDFQNGLNKGDVIFVVGPKNAEVGDVIIFSGNAIHPIIHRLIDDDPYSTKGDNYKTNNMQLPSEKEIPKELIIGKAVFKIPYVGWIKLFFFDLFSNNSEKGFCK